jgi:hypothetical protein
MHAIGVGSMAAFMLILSFVKAGDMSAGIAVSLLIAGTVCTARFLVSDHTTRDIYSGLLLGIFCQVIAAFFTL